MKQFLGLLLIGAVAITASNASAQSRDIGARRITIGDNSGQSITLQLPPSGGWTGQRIWNIPLPPNDVVESGFTAKGTTNGEILSWDGSMNYWKGASTSDLGLVTATTPGTTNALPRFIAGNNLGDSRVTDDGTAVAIDGGDVVFDYTAGLNTFNTPIQSNQNLDVRGTIFDASGALTLDDHVEIANTLTVTGNVLSSGATLTIDDALAINGTLSNTNPLTELTISDDIIVTGISNLNGGVRDLNSELLLDDQVRTTNWLELGGPLRSTTSTVTIEDDVAIEGAISNTNGATPLTINDDIQVTGISNLNGDIRDLNTEVIIDDQLRTTGWLEVGGPLRSTSSTLTIEDDVAIEGALSNTNGATELTINDDIIVTGISNLNGNVRDLNSELVFDDQVRTTSWLEVGGPLRSTSSTLTIEDDVAIEGALSNTNGATELTINDDIIVTGISNLNGIVRDLNSELVLDDQVRTTNWLELGGALRSSGTTVSVEDDLAIQGSLSNTNALTELTINDDIIVTGISNLNGNVRDLSGDLTLDDNILVTGLSTFQQTLTASNFVMNSPAAANVITFGDVNPGRTGLAINNTGGSPDSYGLRIGNTNRTRDGLTVDADRYAIQAQTESSEDNPFAGAIDGMITGGAVSTIGDVGAAIVARGRATGGGTQQYSNAIILQNGAFAVGGGIMPAGQMLNVDLSGATTSVTINNPLCTSSSIVMLTPLSADAASAGLYISATSNGNFTLTRTGAASADIDFNYFIITVVTP